MEDYPEDGAERWEQATRIAAKPSLGSGPPAKYGDPVLALKKLRREAIPKKARHYWAWHEHPVGKAALLKKRHELHQHYCSAELKPLVDPTRASIVLSRSAMNERVSLAHRLTVVDKYRGNPMLKVRQRTCSSLFPPPFTLPFTLSPTQVAERSPSWCCSRTSGRTSAGRSAGTVAGCGSGGRTSESRRNSRLRRSVLGSRTDRQAVIPGSAAVIPLAALLIAALLKTLRLCRPSPT